MRLGRASCVAFCVLVVCAAVRARCAESPYSETPDLPKTPFTDFTSPIKNVPLGCGFSGSLGGSVQHRYQDLDNRRDFNSKNTHPDDHDPSILARERINGEISYEDIARVFVEGQDAHELLANNPPGKSPNDNALDLYQAYVEADLIPDIVDKPSLVLRVGRQELFYGDGRLFSNDDWLNTGQVFDVAKVIWRPDGFQIDAFAGWPVAIRAHKPDPFTTVDKIAGFNLRALGVPLKQTLEAYSFYKWNDDPDEKGEAGRRGPTKLWTTGGRAEGAFFKHFDYDTEVSLQYGERGGNAVFAGRGAASVGYTIPFNWRSVRLSGNATVASGDVNLADHFSNRFDPLFGDPFAFHGKLLIAADTNLIDYNPRLEARVWRGGLISLDYHGLQLDRSRDAFFQANNTVLRSDPTGRAGRDAGQEFDAQFTHVLHENMSVSGGVFFFKPGELFEHTKTKTHDTARNVFIMVKMDF